MKDIPLSVLGRRTYNYKGLLTEAQFLLCCGLILLQASVAQAFEFETENNPFQACPGSEWGYVAIRESEIFPSPGQMRVVERNVVFRSSERVIPTYRICSVFGTGVKIISNSIDSGTDRGEVALVPGMCIDLKFSQMKIQISGFEVNRGDIEKRINNARNAGSLVDEGEIRSQTKPNNMEDSGDRLVCYKEVR